MRNVTAVLLASTVALTTFMTSAAEVATCENVRADNALKRIMAQSRMFDGINLSEQQRQQMRDLMHQARKEHLALEISEMDAMHQLITADKFDEAAVRRQAEKMAQEQVARQVEMAKIRNQMYHLLTPDQQAVLNEKHQQRMSEFRALSDMQRQYVPSLQAYSSTRSNQ